MSSPQQLKAPVGAGRRGKHTRKKVEMAIRVGDAGAGALAGTFVLDVAAKSLQLHFSWQGCNTCGKLTTCCAL